MPVEKIIEPVRPEAVAVVPKQEQAVTPERSVEQTPVSREEKPRDLLRPIAHLAVGIKAAPSAPAWQKQRAEAIDNILSEGLNDIFLKMNASQQKAFKQKGEETVAKINELLSHAKVKVNKIIKLIRDWLKMIPGINKFFLEQEIKIKADKIIKIKDKF